jgi:hypothetical protein
LRREFDPEYNPIINSENFASNHNVEFETVSNNSQSKKSNHNTILGKRAHSNSLGGTDSFVGASIYDVKEEGNDFRSKRPKKH